MKIGKRDLQNHVYVIAEIGGNHNGNPEVAMQLVREAATAGADAVKFQTYRAETLVHPDLAPVPLVKKHYKSQFDRFKSLELGAADYDRIIALTHDLGIDFMTTPFDLDILQTMQKHMPAIKIASGDLTYHELIQQAGATGKPVIVSTGMSEIPEIDAVVAKVPKAQLALLHCVSLYPLADENVNLRAITTMRKRWPDHIIGYSDHTIGPEACLAAVALGARIIEKHFTLDTRQTPGDHVLSLDPATLAQMIQQIRRIEKMLGSEQKAPAPGEMEMRHRMRRGLYTARALKAGSRLTRDDILVIRPGQGMGADRLPQVIGKTLAQDVAAQALLDLTMLVD